MQLLVSVISFWTVTIKQSSKNTDSECNTKKYNCTLQFSPSLFWPFCRRSTNCALSPSFFVNLRVILFAATMTVKNFTRILSNGSSSNDFYVFKCPRMFFMKKMHDGLAKARGIHKNRTHILNVAKWYNWTKRMAKVIIILLLLYLSGYYILFVYYFNIQLQYSFDI